MVDTIQYGMSSVADMVIPRSHPHFKELDARIPKYAYDPRRAEQLLLETGYTRGAEGLLHNTAGQRLEVEIRSTADVDIQRKSLPTVANYLRQVGVATVETLIPTQLAGDRPYRVSFPGLEMLRGPIGEEAFLGLESMHSTKIPTPENRYFSGNYPRYSNPQWDALVDRFSVTIPYAERMQVLSDMLYFLADQLPHMPLFFDTQVVLVNNRLVNVDAHQTGLGTQGWDAHRWAVK
jgi:peptide/nickel transport system substrate-binding protein